MTSPAIEAPPARACGACRLCCKVLEVPELSKEPGKWCPHACKQGCDRHETRPQSCRDFVCLWLKGLFEDGDRPDRSRLVVVAAEEDGRPRVVEHPETKSLLPLVLVYESSPGDVDGAGRYLARSMLVTGRVALAIMDAGGERVREIRYPALETANGSTKLPIFRGGRP